MKELKKTGETHGEFITRAFDDLGRMEEVFRTMMLDLRNRIYQPDLLDAAIKAKAAELFKRPIAWVRVICNGVTQQEMDQMRQLFPGILPGHTKLNEAKSTLLEKIQTKLPIVKFPNGHGHDFGTVLKVAAATELTTLKDRMPKALVIAFSLDAKLLFSDHFTQVTFR